MTIWWVPYVWLSVPPPPPFEKSWLRPWEWLWNPTTFFVVCFCSLFWPWPCTKHSNCLLCTEDLTNKEVWGEEIFPEGVGVKCKNCPTPHPQITSAPILYLSSIEDGGIENPIYYLAFRSKITLALQAILVTSLFNFQWYLCTNTVATTFLYFSSRLYTTIINYNYYFNYKELTRHVPFKRSTTWSIKSLSNCQLGWHNVMRNSHKAWVRLRTKLPSIFSFEIIEVD